MVWAVLALTVRLTLPVFDADSTGCAPGVAPCTDLDFLVAEAQPVCPAGPMRRVAALSVRGREGERLTLNLPLSADSAYSVRVWTADTTGNRSCPVWLAVGPWPLMVERRAATQVGPWHDVAGRRVGKHLCDLPSGVYLRRVGTRVERVALIR